MTKKIKINGTIVTELCVINKIVVKIKITNIIGLKIKIKILGIAIFLGSFKLPFKRSLKLFTHLSGATYF